MPLLPDDQRHLTAAEGYAALGMYLDADAELDEIDPEVRHVAEVLAVRVEIYQGLEKWELMGTVAKRLTDLDPDNSRWPLAWAFAARRAESVDAARYILIDAWKLHEKEPMIPFQIACCLCQIGKVEIAKEILATAFELDPKLRLMALDYDDLAPLWDSLGA